MRRLHLKVIQAGNGESFNILLIYPIIITIQVYMFEINTIVSEIHDNINLMLGVKTFVE